MFSMWMKWINCMIKYEIFDSLVFGKTGIPAEELFTKAKSIIKRKYDNNDVKYIPYERLFI